MAKRSRISTEDFERLCHWFSQDRDAAARRYVETHERLTRWCYFKGCDCPEDLADEVLSRVAKKATLLASYDPDSIRLLLGYARKVYLEYKRDKERFGDKRDPDKEASGNNDTVAAEIRARCLERCLQKLNENDRQLLLGYHEYDPGEQIEHRKAIAEARQTTLNAIRLKVSRLMSNLGNCVKSCCRSSDKIGVQ